MYIHRGTRTESKKEAGAPTRESAPQISNSDESNFSICCCKCKREIWDEREKQAVETA